jgi:hypothetical protein
MKISSSKPAWATEGDPVSKKTTTTNNKNLPYKLGGATKLSDTKYEHGETRSIKKQGNMMSPK